MVTLWFWIAACFQFRLRRDGEAVADLPVFIQSPGFDERVMVKRKPAVAVPVLSNQRLFTGNDLQREVVVSHDP